MRRTSLLAALLVATGGFAAFVWHARSTGEDDAPGRLRSIAEQEAALAAKAQVNAEIFASDTTVPTFGGDQPLRSQMCTQAQMETEAFKRWTAELKDEPWLNHKLWQYSYILQALHERGLMTAGKRGIGFGVGQEQLPAVFAKHGVEVLATDLDFAEAKKLGWVDGKQHMSSIDVLNQRGIATEEEFRRLVKARTVDMNAIPSELTGYDFAWSTCALGHLGSLDKGRAFIENSLATVKPGGFLVHTTEINLTSNEHTQENANTSVFRKRDLEELAAKLRAQGHEITLNFHVGNGPLDRLVDEPPFHKEKHLRHRIVAYAITSFGLIIRKNPNAAPSVTAPETR